MTPKSRDELFDLLQDEERKLLSAKGGDYAGKEDALRNFKLSAERLGLTKYQVWSAYFLKHIDAILNAIKLHPDAPKRESESVLGSVHDARNYLGLLACLLYEDAMRCKPGDIIGTDDPRKEKAPPCDHFFSDVPEFRARLRPDCMKCGAPYDPKIHETK